jgi:hypothetical protein
VVIIDIVVMKLAQDLLASLSMSIVNIGLPITNFGLAYVIAIGNFGLSGNCFNCCLPFIVLDEIFCCCG